MITGINRIIAIVITVARRRKTMPIAAHFGILKILSIFLTAGFNINAKNAAIMKGGKLEQPI